MQSRTRSIVLIGLSIALLALGAAIVIPLGPVPFTCQSLMLVLIIFVLTPKESVAAVGGYLALGAIGLPIFAGFKGGMGVFLGPTGGFLIGFFIATCLIAVLRTLFASKLSSLKTTLAFDVLSAIILLLVYYSFGVMWYTFSTGASVEAAMLACVVPFVPADIAKAVVAFSFAQPVRMALGRASYVGKNAKAAGTISAGNATEEL